MKKTLNSIKVAGGLVLLCFVAANPSCAQSNDIAVASTSEPSGQFDRQLLKYETNVSEYEAEVVLELDKPLDESVDEVSKAIQPLKDTVDALRRGMPDMDRKERARLWFKILAEIDKHYDANFIATNGLMSVSGWISALPGYKGKVGIYGMLPPDTNDTLAYSYYIAAVKSDRVRRKKAYLQRQLQDINTEASLDVKLFLQSEYNSSAADKQEFDELIGQSALSDTRKQDLKGVLPQAH